MTNELLTIFLFGLLFVIAVLAYEVGRSSELRRDQMLRRRLGRLEPEPQLPGKIPAAVAPSVQTDPDEESPLLRGLAQYCFQAGLRIRARTLLSVILGVFLAALVVLLHWLQLLTALAGAAAVAALPLLYLWLRRARRLRALSEQLPYLLDLLKSGLESGHTVLRALQMAARNLPDPLAGEVQLVVDKVQVGMSVPQAFDSVFRRAPIDELSLLAGAFRIQAEIGSSLGEILAHVAQSLRNRQRAERQIQALTAQSRFSAVVVTVLPFVVLLGLSIVAPGYARPLLETDVGMKLFETAIFCDVLAFLVMRRISRVDY